MNGRFVTLATLGTIAIIVIAALCVVTLSRANDAEADNRDILFQVSAFNTFSTGQYEGTTTFNELARHGDFGIGTLNGLDGEMVAVDGEFYQVPIDGKPVEINPSALTPYATITFFEADQTLYVNELNYSELTSYIDQALPSSEQIYAIKVNGTFEYAQTRSVPIQTEPYPTLSEVISQQAIFNLTEVTGTAVGFYFPESMSGVDFAGYHLHFITDDHTAGGHLLNCIIIDATIEIDYTNKYTLIL